MAMDKHDNKQSITSGLMIGEIRVTRTDYPGGWGAILI